MFDGTIESLTERAVDLPIQRETRTAALLVQYEQGLEAGQPDTMLLQQAHRSLQEALLRRGVDRELAHLAVALSYHLSDWSEAAQWITHYRQGQLAPYEKAWAWWHQVDYLALLPGPSTAIEEQRALIRWAQEALPPVHRLFAIADTTQALIWLSQGKTSEWVDLSQELLAQTPVCLRTRFDRFLLLRSMLTIAFQLRQQERASSLLTQVDTLIQEDPAWERREEVCLETLALRLAFANQSQDRRSLCALGEQALEHYSRLAEQWEHPTLSQRQCLRRLAHNLGAEFYEAQLYELARPFFEQAVSLGSTTCFTYLWLMACIWELQRDESSICELLQQAQRRDTGADFQSKLHALVELHGWNFGRLLEKNGYTTRQE